MGYKYFIHCVENEKFAVYTTDEFKAEIKNGNISLSKDMSDLYIAQFKETSESVYQLVEKYHSLNKEFSENFDAMIQKDHICDLVIYGEKIRLYMSPIMWDSLNDFLVNVISSYCLEYGDIEELGDVVERSNLFVADLNF